MGKTNWIESIGELHGIATNSFLQGKIYLTLDLFHSVEHNAIIREIITVPNEKLDAICLFCGNYL